MLRWLTRHLFSGYAHVSRIEGYTREDNAAMRGVFSQCGYVKEAHHRQSWPDADGEMHDSVGYAILRCDWESGRSTLVRWEA